MGYRPNTQREALLQELKGRHGYVVNPLTPGDLATGSRDDIARRVLRIEGLDPVLDSKQYDEVCEIVNDWLFDPRGRGARSGLPR